MRNWFWLLTSLALALAACAQTPCRRRASRSNTSSSATAAPWPRWSSGSEHANGTYHAHRDLERARACTRCSAVPSARAQARSAPTARGRRNSSMSAAAATRSASRSTGSANTITRRYKGQTRTEPVPADTAGPALVPACADLRLAQRPAGQLPRRRRPRHVAPYVSTRTAASGSRRRPASSTR